MMMKNGKINKKTKIMKQQKIFIYNNNKYN